MKRRFFESGVKLSLLVILVSILITNCRSIKQLDSQWLSQPIPAKGEMSDLTKHLNCHLLEKDVILGFGNDEDHLYIFFSPDYKLHQRILTRATLTLWIDRTGGKNKEFGLIYVNSPYNTKPRESESLEEWESTDAFPKQPGLDLIGQLRDLASKIRLIDKTEKRETFIPSDGSMGPLVRFSSEWGDYTYECRLPLRPTGSSNRIGLDVRPGQVIAIGFIWESQPLFDFKKKLKDKKIPGPALPLDDMSKKRHLWVYTQLQIKKQ